MEPVRIGVIGGSGVYELGALQDVEEIRLETPFGQPSDAYIVGTLEGQRVAFPEPPRPRPSHRADAAQQPGQHLGLQEAGRRISDRGQRLRQLAGTSGPRRHRGAGPALRPHPAAQPFLLRRPQRWHRRHRRPCVGGQPLLRVPVRGVLPRGAERRRTCAPGRHLRHHRRARASAPKPRAASFANWASRSSA